MFSWGTSLLSKCLFLILVKMAGDCGLNALSLLPENELPQWQQKIALRAENPSGRCVTSAEHLTSQVDKTSQGDKSGTQFIFCP